MLMCALGYRSQLKASGAEGVRMEEAIKINTSLAAFGKGVPIPPLRPFSLCV